MLGKTILDEPVLLGRDKTGDAFAMVDICPHRGIPLRFGKFDGCTVQCRYHGWRFAPSGECTSIPPLIDDQIPDLSKLNVRSYPVHEAQGNIWVFFGKNADSAPPLPIVPELQDMKPKLHERMIFASPMDHSVIGLMDPAHGAYVHQSWFWRKSAVEKAKEFEPSPWGFTMKRHAPSKNSRAYMILGGANQRTTEIAFRLPGTRIELIRLGRHLVCNLTTLTPISDQETEINHMVYWTNPLLNLGRPLFRRLLHQFLGQDRDAVEQQQIGLKHEPTLLLLGDPDAQARWYFRLKAEFRRAEQENRPFVNPIKPRTLRWRS